MFGFFDKEVDIYIVFLGQGEVKVSEFVQYVGVFKCYVYNVFGSFEDCGFVEVNDYEMLMMICVVDFVVVIRWFFDQLFLFEMQFEFIYNFDFGEDRCYEVIKLKFIVKKCIVLLV